MNVSLLAITPCNLRADVTNDAHTANLDIDTDNNTYTRRIRAKDLEESPTPDGSDIEN